MPPDATPDGRPPDDDATRVFRPAGDPPPLFPDDDDEWARPLGPARTPPASEAPPPVPVAVPDTSPPDPFAPPPGDPVADADLRLAPATSDPFAPPAEAPPVAPDPFRPAPPAADPFAPPADTLANADLRFAPPADPFAALRDSPAQAASPAPAPAADPFGPLAADPFAPATSDPFALPAPSIAPLAPPPAPDDPFAPRVPASPLTARPAPDPFDSAVRPAMPADPFAASPVAHAAPASPVKLPVEGDRLAGAFASVFALILHLRTSADFGDAAALRSRAESLIDQAAAAARAGGADGTAVRDAEFAVVAFLDETVLTSDWPGRDAWAAQPLQLARYNRYDAGEAFFERLRVLLAGAGNAAASGQDEVLEVYYLCLALGYKGRYQIHGREVLGQLIDDLSARLARAPGVPTALAPHAKPTGPAAVATRGGIPTWALFVGAAVLVGLLYLVLSLSVSGVAREVADDVRALPAAAP